MRSAAKWRSSRRSSFSMLTEFQPQPKQEEVWNVGAKNRWVIGLSLFCSSNMAIWRDPSFSDPNIWWQRSVGPCGVARFCMLPTMRKYPLTNHAWRRKWDWTHVVLAMPWWHLMPWDAMWCQAWDTRTHWRLNWLIPTTQCENRKPSDMPLWSSKQYDCVVWRCHSDLEALAYIQKETGAEIVLSSTWRLWEGKTGRDAVDKARKKSCEIYIYIYIYYI